METEALRTTLIGIASSDQMVVVVCCLETEDQLKLLGLNK